MPSVSCGQWMHPMTGPRCLRCQRLSNMADPKDDTTAFRGTTHLRGLAETHRDYACFPTFRD